MATVNIHEAKTHLSALLDRVVAGEEIIIAKAGRPIARLSPVAGLGPRTPGALKGKFRLTDAFFEPLSDDELAAWEGRER
jgi:prevent-host-death family protein